MALTAAAPDTVLTFSTVEPVESTPGDVLLAPSDMWPEEPCNEADGQGWAVRVLSRVNNDVLVEFVDNMSEGDLAWEPMLIAINDLDAWPEGVPWPAGKAPSEWTRRQRS